MHLHIFISIFFYFMKHLEKMNDRSKVDVDVLELMHCVISYNNPMFFIVFTKDHVEESSNVLFQE